MTATDVVNTFHYYLDPKTVSQEKNRINMVDTITAVNPTTALFKLKTANALFPTAIINVKIVKTDDLANFSTNPITTGPYKVASFVPDSTRDARAESRITSAPKAKLNKIEIVKAADSTAATAALLCRRPGRPLGPPVVLGQESGSRPERPGQARHARSPPRSRRSGRPTRRARRSTTSRTAGAGLRDRPPDDPQVGLCRARDRVPDEHVAVREQPLLRGSGRAAR